MSKTGPEVVLFITLLPRGTGNRAAVKRLGEAARRSMMAPHIKRMVCGSTRLTLYLRSSVALAKTLLEWSASSVEGAKDVEGQMPLFGGLVPG